ncbi:MAG: hypothetical protein NT033_00290 [Candidatus Omnitrophica bacterium]|nr:hypothetical protein [Candidatus Omnitrophota bacterium]
MPHKLLIIDDSRGCADMYRMRFEKDGWEVKITYSAEAAIELSSLILCCPKCREMSCSI